MKRAIQALARRFGYTIGPAPLLTRLDGTGRLGIKSAGCGGDGAVGPGPAGGPRVP
jgi:hypothetical protein